MFTFLRLTFLLLGVYSSLSLANANATLSETTDLEERSESRLQKNIDAAFEELEHGDTDLDRLREKLKEVEPGSEKDAIFLRLNQRAIKQLDVYNDLTRWVVEQRLAGADVDLSLAQLKTRMLPLGPKIRRVIKSREKEFDMATSGLPPTSEESLLKLEERNVFSDMAYRLLSRHSRNLEELNFNNSQTSAYLQESLYDRAESLSGQIQLAATQKSRAESNLSNNPDDQGAKSKFSGAQRQVNILTDSLRSTIEIMEENNIDSTLYRQLLIRTTGELTTDILKPSIFMGLIENWWHRVIKLVKKYSAEILFKSLIFFSLLILFYYISNITSRVVRKGLRKASMKVSMLMEEMLVSMAARLVLFMGVLIALSQVGVSLAPVLAGLGVAGFIIGFALQDTLGNFASGMMILIYRPFDVGDMIETGSVKGNVNSMNLVSTTILTIDHQTLVIPNNKIWGDVINNLTAQKLRRVDMLFGVAYSENSAQVEKILNDILDQHPLVLDKPERLVKLHNLGESSVDFIVRPWVETEHYWDVYWDVTRAVKDRFDETGISIPFPQRDVHLYQHGAKADDE